MSRTEGITLPRLPPEHARASSSKAIQPHAAASGSGGAMNGHRRSTSEPNYTAFVGTPRQDVPQHVYRDAAMFDDVFDKKGELLQDRNISKFESPLKSLGYSSLHDVHCRKLFMNNRHVKNHLVNLGLITADLKVVASTTEQRQKIRAHELLERKEQLQQKLDSKEHNRIDRLVKLPALPSSYLANLKRTEERQERARAIASKKIEKKVHAMERSLQDQRQKYEEDQKKLLDAMEQASLLDQARRNAAHAQQEIAETAAYSKRYGMYGFEMASWYRDSDLIHNRMVAFERKGWPGKRKLSKLNEDGYKTLERPPETISSPIPVLPNIGEKKAGSPLPSQSPVATAEENIPQPSTSRTTPPVAASEDIVTSPDAVERVPSPPQSSGSEAAGKEPEVLAESSKQSSTIEHTDIDPPTDSGTGDAAAPSSETSVDDHGKQRESGVEPKEEVRAQESSSEMEAASTDVEVIVLDPDDAFAELVQVLVDVFVREDLAQSGFIPLDSFVNVIGSRRLGLQLNEEEILYLMDVFNIQKSNHIPFIQIASELPQHLVMIYRNRAENTIDTYGGYAEEQWCEIISRKRKRGVVYFHKLNGMMMIGARPEDFRPFMKEEPFEDAIVDFFEMADVDRNGIITYADFYSLLVSPMVSTRVYKNQIEQLLSTYIQYYTEDGLLTLEMFVPIARLLLLMIYQNTYLGEEVWIELESRKMGRFYFNKSSGETFLPSSEGELPPGVTLQTKTAVKKRKKKTSNTVSWSDLRAPSNSQTGPPPLIKKAKEGSQDDLEASRTDNSSDN